MRRRWCRASSVGEQKRFPVIAIKFQGFLGQALWQFLFCVSPRLGPKYHLSDWGWCISGELLMLLAAAKNSHAPLGLTDPRSWSTWSGPDEKSNTAKMPFRWCCLWRRADPNLGQWGWIERLRSFLSSWNLLLLLLLSPPSLPPFSKERPRAVADTGSGGGSWVETERPEIRWSWGKERKKRKNVAGSVLFGGVQVPSNRVQSQVYKGRFWDLIVFLWQNGITKNHQPMFLNFFQRR